MIKARTNVTSHSSFSETIRLCVLWCIADNIVLWCTFTESKIYMLSFKWSVNSKVSPKKSNLGFLIYYLSFLKTSLLIAHSAKKLFFMKKQIYSPSSQSLLIYSYWFFYFVRYIVNVRSVLKYTISKRG